MKHRGIWILIFGTIVINLLAFRASDSHAYTDPYGEPCSYCKCAMLDGVIIASKKVGSEWQFAGGWWYYERNEDGSSGPVTTNAAVRLHYNPNLHSVTCINRENSRQTGVTINRYAINGTLACTPSQEVGMFHNGAYPANATPPAGNPEAFNQAECIPPES